MIRTFVLGGWLAVTIFAFWRYDGRYRLPVASKPAARPSAGHDYVDQGAKATLLAFYTPGCACSSFAMAEVDRISERWGTKGLSLKIVLEGEGDGPSGYEIIRDDGQMARSFGVPAAPGAVVLNEKGDVVYTGGFNVSRFCNDRKTSYAEQAVEALLNGRKPRRRTGEFYGCALSQGKP